MNTMQRIAPHEELFFNSDYHQLIGLIYDAVTGPGGFFPFLERFVKVFNGHSGSFAIYNTQDNAALGYWVVNIPQQALDFYLEHVAHQDVLIQTAVQISEEKGPRFIATNLDIPNIDRLRETTRAGEWMASYGAYHAAGAVVFQNNNYVNFLGIQRALEQPAFTRKELAVFDMFLPHINRALELYLKMSAIDLTSVPERAALNQVKRGILICNASFKIIFKNSAADDAFANNPAIRITDEGVLSFRDKTFSRELATALSEAVRDSLETGRSEERVLCYRRHNHNLTLIVSPLSAVDAHKDATSPSGGAMISLYDWTNKPTINIDLLQRIFGLSPVESRVSALLLQGLSPADVATEMSRSRETIKSHLRSIYRKTNTNRQGELVALLATSSGLD